MTKISIFLSVLYESHTCLQMFIPNPCVRCSIVFLPGFFFHCQLPIFWLRRRCSSQAINVFLHQSWHPAAGSWIVATTTSLEALCQQAFTAAATAAGPRSPIKITIMVASSFRTALSPQVESAEEGRVQTPPVTRVHSARSTHWLS